MTLAHGLGLMDDLNTRLRFGRMTGEKLGDDFARAIGGVALDDDDLFGGLRERLRPHSIQKCRHSARFVVYGDDYRYFHGCPWPRRRYLSGKCLPRANRLQ